MNSKQAQAYAKRHGTRRPEDGLFVTKIGSGPEMIKLSDAKRDVTLLLAVIKHIEDCLGEDVDVEDDQLLALIRRDYEIENS